MKKTFSKLLVAQLAALVLASFALAPVAEARDAGGGGRGGGGGGGQARASAGSGGGGGQARASGGGGARQVDSSKADARTNNVRSNSTNNVNSNRNTNVNSNTNVNRNTNVNVNVNNNGGGWDNDYHPVGRAVAVGATVAVTAAVVGSMVNTVPAGCVPVNYGGMVYQQCGGAWYQPQGAQYVVVNPPY